MRHRLLADETILLLCLQRLGLQDRIWPSWFFDQHVQPPFDSGFMAVLPRMQYRYSELWDCETGEKSDHEETKCRDAGIGGRCLFFVSYAVVSDRFLAFLNTEKRNIEKSRTRTVFQSHGGGKSFERLRGFLLQLNAAPFIPQWNIELHLSQQQKNTLTYRNSILSRTIGSRTFQDSSTYLRC